MAKRPPASRASSTRRRPVRPAKPPAVAPRRTSIYVLSDSTGNLPAHMLAAFLTQFPPGTFVVHHRPFLVAVDQVDAALAQCDASISVVFHALVSADAKAVVERYCRKVGLPQCDLTGPFVQFLAEASGVPARADVRGLHEMNEAYDRRVQALEFTLVHDDGLGLDTLHEADIVLAGVSRTSKTPTSIYLAQQGYKVANVALARQVAPPPQLLALPPGRVVGLVIDPQQLSAIRTRRNADWQMPGTTSYNDEDAVMEEVRWSRRLFAKHGWPVLDVTNQAIEETAGRIVNVLGRTTASPAAAASAKGQR